MNLLMAGRSIRFDSGVLDSCDRIRGVREMRRSMSHKLIATLLSLMVLVTFSVSAVAACGMPMADGEAHSHAMTMGGEDCHSAGDSDCPHHAPDRTVQDCAGLDDCSASAEAVASAERKPARMDLQPDAVLAATPPMPAAPVRPSRVPAPVAVGERAPERPSYLIFCCFIE